MIQISLNILFLSNKIINLSDKSYVESIHYFYLLLKKEIRKLFDAKIVFSLRFSKWLANLAPVRKNNEEIYLQVLPKFLYSTWHKDIVYVLQHLQAPVDMKKVRARFIKIKVVNSYILDGYLYWKEPRGVLLNCLLENEEKQVMKKFHEGVCGGHHYWKATVNMILRAFFIGLPCFLMCIKMYFLVIVAKNFEAKENYFL